MYKVTNITQQTEKYCDAIETIKVVNDEYVPEELALADGFKAMTIVEVSPTQQYYEIEYLVFEGHTLKGTEDEGRYEREDDEE